MDQNFSSDSRKRVSENSKLIQKTDLAALARFFDSPLNFRRPFSGKSRRPYIGKDPIPFLLIAPRASSLPSPLSSPSPSPYPFPSYRSLWVGPGPLTGLILTAFVLAQNPHDVPRLPWPDTVPQSPPLYERVAGLGDEAVPSNGSLGTPAVCVGYDPLPSVRFSNRIF